MPGDLLGGASPGAEAPGDVFLAAMRVALLAALLLAAVFPALAAAIVLLDWRYLLWTVGLFVLSFAVSMVGAGMWPGLGELTAEGEGGHLNALEFPRNAIREVDIGKGWSKGGFEVILFPYLAGINKLAEGRAVSVGLLANAADVFPELVRRGVRPDAVTDQTSAHDPLNGYLPAGWTLEQAIEARERDLVGDQYRRLDARAAGTLQIHTRRAQRQSRIDHALASEVPVTRMLDDRAKRHIAHGLATQVELDDEPLQGRCHEVLVGALSVDGMRTAERDTRAADHGNANGSTIVQHIASGEVSHEREATLHY